MSESDWLDANARYMAAAVAWIRALLQQRAPVITTAMPARTRRGLSWPQLRQRDQLVPNLNLLSDESGSQLARSREEMAEASETMTPPPALLVLARRLGLSVFEQNLLLLCASVEIDTSVAGLCARVHGDPARAFPTFALALSIFEQATWDALSPERPMRHWRLIEISQPGATPLTVSPLRADERIVNFLKGVTYLDDRLTSLLSPMAAMEGDVPPSQRVTAERALRQWRAAPAERPRPAIQLLGADSASKRIVASLISATLERRPLRLDASLLSSSPPELESLARLWQRESTLLPVALYLDADEIEATQGGGAVDRLLARLDGLVFLATRNLWLTGADAPIAVEVAKPTPAEQHDCWAAALGGEGGNAPQSLASQFDLNAPVIRELVRRETVDADADPASLRDRLWDAAREHARPRLDTLARRLVPKAGWNDIVLPAAEMALLRRIADQVGDRATVYRDWGFGERMNRGLGISVLFSGPPGSGKTLAAEVLAGHLRLDLFRIDLSTVVSKYIGETESNLRRLFDAAEGVGAILFFDEADALFGKRTEVKDSHDRYANIEIDYLLQRMESYRGLAILATNMKSALDQAFLRRLRFVLDMPFPGPTERRAIWKNAFPPATPTVGLDFDRLARLNVTGGHIAVIALNAAFQAARAGTGVTMPIVLDAARIEFRKLGRPVNENDFRWQGTAA